MMGSQITAVIESLLMEIPLILERITNLLDQANLLTEVLHPLVN